MIARAGDHYGTLTKFGFVTYLCYVEGLNSTNRGLIMPVKHPTKEVIQKHIDEGDNHTRHRALQSAPALKVLTWALKKRLADTDPEATSPLTITLRLSAVAPPDNRNSSIPMGDIDFLCE